MIGLALSQGVHSSSMLAENNLTKMQTPRVVLRVLFSMILIYFWLRLFVVVDMIFICLSFHFLTDGLISLFN